MPPTCHWEFADGSQNLELICEPEICPDLSIPPRLIANEQYAAVWFVMIAFFTLLVAITLAAYFNEPDAETVKIAKIRQQSPTRKVITPPVYVPPKPETYVPPQVEEEEKEVEVTKECDICANSLHKRAVLLPCGHATTCPGCAEQVINCPLCRAPIIERKIIFV